MFFVLMFNIAQFRRQTIQCAVVEPLSYFFNSNMEVLYGRNSSQQYILIYVLYNLIYVLCILIYMLYILIYVLYILLYVLDILIFVLDILIFVSSLMHYRYQKLSKHTSLLSQQHKCKNSATHVDQFSKGSQHIAESLATSKLISQPNAERKKSNHQPASITRKRPPSSKQR